MYAGYSQACLEQCCTTCTFLAFPLMWYKECNKIVKIPLIFFLVSTTLFYCSGENSVYTKINLFITWAAYNNDFAYLKATINCGY